MLVGYFHIEMDSYLILIELRFMIVPHPSVEKTGLKYMIERILARRGARGPRTEYLVEWKGYPLWESSWVKKTELGDAREAIAEYEASL